MSGQQTVSNYTIGWICALPIEMAAAKVMLDEIHPKLPQAANDQNSYCLGSINGRNIAVACLQSDVHGIKSAANVASSMLHTFPSIKFGLMGESAVVCLDVIATRMKQFAWAVLL